jgi:serine/threonine protein kinase
MRPGIYVTDKVKLVRPLGKGGMGSVWVAHHEALDAEVAVKFVSADVGDKDDTAIARFKREAALSAKFKNPHVVKTFDHGVMDDGQPYIVMEMLEGETVGERLLREKRLPTRDVSVIVAQVAQVLDEAHELGVVHRDIKADNVFLLESGYDVFVKVLDFGIAKQTQLGEVGHVTATDAIVGTPEYMSPEQLLSTRSADYRADLWALAVLAYHGLTGRVPFTGETLPALSMAICNSRFQPPTEIVTGLPAEVDTWFARALHTDPGERFDSVREMSDAFRHIVHGESDQAMGRPDDSGIRQSFNPADADQSGRRQTAIVETPQSRSTSPTFSGSSSNLASDPSHGRKGSRIKLAAVLLSAVVAAVAADVLLRRGSDDAAATPGSPLGLPLGPPLATSPAPTANTSSVRPHAAAGATASAAATASASMSASSKGAPPSSSHARPSPSTISNACDNPYIVAPDGTLKIKPQCL